uniref:fructokinase n=1 Tax=Lygus hesperus TaxID=30085 RepID=A0A0A9YE54_LYGHE
MTGLRIGGVECGGTTFAVTFAIDSPLNIIEKVIIPTTTPDETLTRVGDQLSKWKINTLGIGSFGPIDLNKKSPTYGFITTTPKPGWQQTDILGKLRKNLQSHGLNIPIGFNTDCNAAALCEVLYGQHVNAAGEKLSKQDTVAYITAGTGVGIGVSIEGRLISGLLHPEGGHMIPRRKAGDNFKGVCPFHGDCVEGLSSTVAAAERICIARDKLASVQDHPEWDNIAYYLAQLCLGIIVVVAPNVIVLGGGMMRNAKLFPLIRKHLATLLNNYIQVPELQTQIGLDRFIVSSRFNAKGSKTTSGAVGCLQLGIDEYAKSCSKL